MSLSVAFESCIRPLSTSANCEKCKSACGEDAVAIDNGFVRIDAKKCTECAACVAVCPTGAITISEISFAALSADELFLAALSEGDLAIDAKSDISERVNEANGLLNAFGINSKITINPAKEQPTTIVEDGSKRALFRLFTKDGIKDASEKLKSADELTGEMDFDKLRSKKLPLKRALFLDALEKLEIRDKNAAMSLSFASDKHIDATCNNCSLCYNLCPSGALSTTQMKNAVLFSAHLCLRCGLCESVCEPKAISSLPFFVLEDFLTRQKKVLIKFKSKLCTSCGAVFSGDDDECPRCRAESEDAMELLGL